MKPARQAAKTLATGTGRGTRASAPPLSRTLIWITAAAPGRCIKDTGGEEPRGRAPSGRGPQVREKAMKEVKVLGTGCGNCRATAKLIEEVASARGVEIRLEKVERLEEIAAAGVMRTPGVIVDGRLVHSGGVPRRQAVEAWF